MGIKIVEPREILLEEFMKPLKITAYRLTAETKMSMTLMRIYSKASEE
ncbi:MAG: hypothetical protein LBN01_03290 [Endomicrobium sp.]|nr:hypothetical protein [Endomicrobium sp.]